MEKRSFATRTSISSAEFAGLSKSYRTAHSSKDGLLSASRVRNLSYHNLVSKETRGLEYQCSY